MEAILFEIVAILMLVVFNGVLAMSEVAIISARKVRLQHLSERGVTGARTALELANSPNHFLSTVQIGITLVGILAGAFGGATLSEQLGLRLAAFPALAPYSEAISFTIVVLIITYLSLIIGELVPKRLGLSLAERVAVRVAKPMRLLSVVSSPVVRLLSFSTESVLRLFGAHRVEEQPISEEEVKILIRQGTAAGIFDPSEQDMVMNVFRLGDRRVEALMTPRRDIGWLDVKDTVAEVRRKLAAHPHTRLPVADSNLDNIIGVVRARDLLVNCLAGKALDLRAAMLAPLFVPEGTPALKVLERFRQTGIHLAVVVDEYGVTQGLLTHHDIIEAVVGDIPSPGLNEEPYAVRRDDGSWLVDGAIPIDEFNQIFGVKPLRAEERSDFQTLAGLVLKVMGRIPTSGDRFEWGGLRFEIMDMDRRRVDKVLVQAVEESPATPLPEAEHE